MSPRKRFVGDAGWYSPGEKRPGLTPTEAAGLMNPSEERFCRTMLPVGGGIDNDQCGDLIDDTGFCPSCHQLQCPQCGERDMAERRLPLGRGRVMHQRQCYCCDWSWQEEEEQ